MQSYMIKLVRGANLVASSTAVAEEVFYGRSPMSYGRKIRIWTSFYMKYLYLPPVCQGKHQKVKPLLCENDILEQCRSFLLGLPRDGIRISIFKNFIETELFPGRTVSENTVRRCLVSLGYSYKQLKKGVYLDGHERPDVQQNRNGFLDKIFIYESYMEKYSGDSMEIVESPNLPEGQKRHVLVVHDESLFYSNDGVSSAWVHPKHPPLRKKGKGKCIMISEFLCECHGRLSWTTELGEVEYATTIITPGKNDDGWWKAENLVHQFKTKAIPMFDRLHPNCAAVFLFDNSTNHGAFADDALNVNNMNLNSGGKQPILRDGWFLQGDGARVVQKMVFPIGHPKAGVPKGIKQVLQERKLWINGTKLPDARVLLSNQPDFVEQKSMLNDYVEEHGGGHVVLFLPKFHCELNFIEMYWGALKYYCRNNCDYSFKTLLPTVTNAMASVSLATIRRFARKCWRYMDAYRQGLSVQQAEWAATKQRSHRRINLTLVPNLN